MIEVTSKVKVYEIDGSDCEFDQSLIVKSHWNQDSLVVLCVGGVKQKSYTVCAGDLKAAIDNATNVKRY